MQHLFLSITLATLLLVAQAPQAEPIMLLSQEAPALLTQE